jgi:hypothetical protein
MRIGQWIWTFTRELQRMGFQKLQPKAIWRAGLIGTLLITPLLSYAQGSSPVYPRGAIILYRNRVAPFRYARIGGANLFRANINFEGELIELALLVKGSDGRYYSNAYRRFRSQDSWILAVATGIHYYDLMALENIVADNWFRPRTQVDLDIDGIWWIGQKWIARVPKRLDVRHIHLDIGIPKGVASFGITLLIFVASVSDGILHLLPLEVESLRQWSVSVGRSERITKH